jgi:hypothetical protein
MLCQWEVTGTFYKKKCDTTRRPETKTEREVEILCNEPRKESKSIKTNA